MAEPRFAPVDQAPGASSIRLGRYLLFDVIATGGMASVHYGRMLGPAGFSRTVAIKRLHPHLARDPEFVAMFLDEARIAARIQHPNVVSTIDIVARDGELFVVMEYVQGDSLSHLLCSSWQAGHFPPHAVLSGVVANALYGLHAAHEATTERGEGLELVHRDVSPQNVLVGADGVARVVDFGVAKAVSRIQSTRDGQLKGKLGYMSPEQIRRRPVDRRTDVYAASVLLWEAIARRRLFRADDPAALLDLILHSQVAKPSAYAACSSKLDAVVMRGLSRDPEVRFSTALEMARALTTAVPPASPPEIGAWVECASGATLSERARRIAEIERTPTDSEAPIALPVSADPRAGEPPSEHRSEVTALSMARSSEFRPKRRAAWIALALLAAAGLAFLGARWPKPRASLRHAAAAFEAPVLSSTASPVMPSVASSAPTPLPAASVRPERRRPTASPSRPKRPSDCDPPFSVDPDTGVRRFKSWCL